MSAAQLNPYEEKLMDEITQDNKLMRRKLEGGKERRKSNRKVPVRVYKPETDSESDIKKKLEEMEKMQVLYQQRINELENQVTGTASARSPKGVRSPNRRRRPNDQQYNMSPKITNASPKITHSSPLVVHSPQIVTASPKILHSSPKNYNSSTRSPKAAHYYNTSPRANSSPRRRRNPLNTDSRGNSFVNALDQSKANTSPSRRNKAHVEQNRVLALYDYIPAPDAVGRLAFKEGDVLTLINSKSRSGWWVAEYKGKSGKIPSNYVEQLDMTKSFKARVIKTFDAQQNGDLSIQRGSIITILKRQENGWYLGERGTTTGFFPASNVEEIDVLSSSS